MKVVSIADNAAIVQEPDWTALFSDELERMAAREHWRVVTGELRERQLLSPANGHAMQRLVCAYLMFDRMYREVAENGPVTKPRKGNSRAIARISPHFSAMREAASDAASMEAELGISPRRRGSAGKTERKAKQVRPADAYLARG